MDHLDPYEEDELALVNEFIQRITELYPEWPLVDRAELAMQMFYVVGKWAKDKELTKKKNKGASTYSVDMTDPLR